MTLEVADDVTLPPGVCLRWRERRGSYRVAGEVENVSRLTVDPIDRVRAKRFGVREHYSGTFPAERVSVGLFRGIRLVGVAVFAEPAQRRTIPRWAPGARLGVILSRFVLLDELAANAETWFLARAFRALRRELAGVGAVVSYSDPVLRRSSDGSLVLPGHVGTIYQGFNGRYLGRSGAETETIAPDGTIVDRRGLSKVRNGERSDAHVVDRLVALGAPGPRPFEDPRAYIARALEDGPFRRVRHPGKHVYAWSLDGSTLAVAQSPTPKRRSE